MFRPLLGGGNKGQVDAGASDRRELNFGFFRRFPQPLQGHAVLPQVDSLVLLKLISHKVNNTLIEIISAQAIVSTGCFYLNDPVSQLPFCPDRKPELPLSVH